jgi:UDP-N-acetylglucosamine 2-epimerase (non-hydrolysing)
MNMRFVVEFDLHPDNHFSPPKHATSSQERFSYIWYAMEQELKKNPTEMVVVVGDVDSTLACTLAARRQGVKVAHVEAGLRSHDISMPEEINRIMVDAVADLALAPDEDSAATLRAMPHPPKVHVVGNVMADTLAYSLTKKAKFDRVIAREMKAGRRIALLTLHRPFNVDDGVRFGQILDSVCRGLPDHLIVFPMHPRVEKMAYHFGMQYGILFFCLPLPHMHTVNLMQACDVVITDSGGISEEATMLNVPCITVRPNTERPLTVTHGTNHLAPDISTLKQLLLAATMGTLHAKPTKPIPLWDGHAAQRIVDALVG